MEEIAMPVFLSAMSANTGNSEFELKPGAFSAFDEKDARQRGIEIARRTLPRHEGFYNHQAGTMEISREELEELARRARTKEEIKANPL